VQARVRLSRPSPASEHRGWEVSDGAIEYEGRRIHHDNAANIARMGIVQVIEGRRVFEHLTVEENLRWALTSGKRVPSVRSSSSCITTSPVCERNAMKRRVRERRGAADDRVGRALMTEPKLVLLDEPSMGLAPKLIHEIFRIITQ